MIPEERFVTEQDELEILEEEIDLTQDLPLSEQVIQSKSRLRHAQGQGPSEGDTRADLYSRGLGGPGSGNFGHAGRAGKRGGSTKGPKVSLSATQEKAFSGQPSGRGLSKLQTGALGEAIVIEYLKSKGFKDARTLNQKGNNFPVDLIQDHEVYEVKTGLSSNGKGAQQWRATIGQPGKVERAWLQTASAKAKAKWNEEKQKAILARKAQAIKTVSAEVGHRVKGKTIGIILNASTRTADLYMFNGFHLRIGWNTPEAARGYKGSFKY